MGGAPGQGWLHQHHDVGELEPWIDEVERISDPPDLDPCEAQARRPRGSGAAHPDQGGGIDSLVTLHKKLSNAGSSILFRAKEST